MMTSKHSKPLCLDVSDMDIIKHGIDYVDYIFHLPFYCVTEGCSDLLNKVMLTIPVDKICNWEVEAFNQAVEAITPCVTENVHLLFPEDSNDEREKKAKTYIKHMVEYAFCNGALMVYPLQTPFSFGYDSYVKSPIKSPPAPRMRLDKTIPSLVDTGIGENWINRSMNNYCTCLFSSISNDCYTHIAFEENLQQQQKYSDQPHKGELFTKHGAKISEMIMCRLDHVFPLQKTQAWKEATAKVFFETLASCENILSFGCGYHEHMKPYIHRNFCTMVQEGKEDKSDAVITVPTMYSMLYTFLQGSKRKQSLNFHLGLDLTRKVFDHLNIRTPDGVKWAGFNQAASSESTAGDADGC
jgi:hypothetical protein